MKDASALKILSRLIEAAKLPNEASLAVFLGISPQAIYQAKKKGLIPPAWAISVAEAFDVSLDWLLMERGHMKPSKVGSQSRDGKTNFEAKIAALEARIISVEAENKDLTNRLQKSQEETLAAYKAALEATRASQPGQMTREQMEDLAIIHQNTIKMGQALTAAQQRIAELEAQLADRGKTLRRVGQ